MALEGGKFLVNCTVNTKCATMNFPPTCCSAASPVSGQRLRCIHGLQVCSENPYGPLQPCTLALDDLLFAGCCRDHGATCSMSSMHAMSITYV
jgi:hypothetical protein